MPFNDTAAPEKKPVPLTVKVNPGPPATTLAGEMLVIVGTGNVMVKVTELDPCPDGLARLICADPGCAIAEAGTVAVTCVALPKVVLKGVPFNDTTAPETKPVPFTVRINAALPAFTVAGEMLVITGAGVPMVNDSAFETTPPTLAVTDADPVCTIRLALTAAVN